MAWWIKGQFSESCNCEVSCRCSVSPFLGSDYDRCLAFIGYHIDAGEVEGST